MSSRPVVDRSARVLAERRVLHEHGVGDADGPSPGSLLVSRLGGRSGRDDDLPNPVLGALVGGCELGEREGLADAAAELVGDRVDDRGERAVPRGVRLRGGQPAGALLPLIPRDRKGQ